ncbi:MAG: YeeE/YedE thiosulfate transporter family protein [Eubacteriales bacterium]|nr:YeeE/YedE thiosulfate transporter family protein [Eubacteriales bacterium]
MISFIFVEPWPWWLGGIVIGLLVPLMYYFLNTALGVSTGYGNFVKLLLPKTKLKWLNSDSFKNIFNWRFFFITGMIIGGIISARTMGLSFATTDMGVFTDKVTWPFIALAGWFLAGGFLLGLGARMADGCTSGHSIHGIANFHLSSIVATVFFLLFGAITVFLIRTFILGGV